MKGLAAVIKGMCIVLLAVILITCVLQVVARYFFNHSFPWVEELATWALVWTTFMGSTLAVINGSHPRIDALLLLMSHKLRCIVEAFDNLVCAAVAGVLAYYTVPLLIQTKSFISTGLKIPTAILYAALFVGGILMTIFFIADAVCFIRDIPNEPSQEVQE